MKNEKQITYCCPCCPTIDSDGFYAADLDRVRVNPHTFDNGKKCVHEWTYGEHFCCNICSQNIKNYVPFQIDDKADALHLALYDWNDAGVKEPMTKRVLDMIEDLKDFVIQRSKL
jgi:hypothetical protein